jgi:hypothetical protein
LYANRAARVWVDEYPQVLPRFRDGSLSELLVSHRLRTEARGGRVACAAPLDIVDELPTVPAGVEATAEPKVRERIGRLEARIAEPRGAVAALGAACPRGGTRRCVFVGSI